jgi:hypothetical protein
MPREERKKRGSKLRSDRIHEHQVTGKRNKAKVKKARKERLATRAAAKEE